MRDDLERRLAALRDEFAKGERVLADLDRERAQVTEQMQRIAGAIQVLEEVLADAVDDQD